MAARLNKHHSETVRAKIQASVLIDLLHKSATGVIELNAQRIKSAEILLDRSVPKLQQIQHSGDQANPVAYTWLAQK